jgi:hypothetical protein
MELESQETFIPLPEVPRLEFFQAHENLLEELRDGWTGVLSFQPSIICPK